MPTATVIIAAWQSAQWIAECIDAILSQYVPSPWDVRILLGIDACQSTFEAARVLNVPKLSVAYFPDQVGPYVIFNSLARIVDSDVLVRFDADDIMLDGYLESQLCRLDPALPPTIMQTWSIYVDADLNGISARLSDGSYTPASGRRNGASHGQMLITRSAWERLGGFQPWPCHADTELIRRARWFGISRRVVRRHLYFRRVHENALTQTSETGFTSPLRKRLIRQVMSMHQQCLCGAAPDVVKPVTADYFLYRYLAEQDKRQVGI